jgi:dolichyl-phosphate-mannose--protein O-mannosyl transferase
MHYFYWNPTVPVLDNPLTWVVILFLLFCVARFNAVDDAKSPIRFIGALVGIAICVVILPVLFFVSCFSIGPYDAEGKPDKRKRQIYWD